MLLSQEDIEGSEFSFYPPLEKRSSKRQVYLMTKTGVIKGITIRRKKSERYLTVEIPPVLIITNRPEFGEAEVETLPKLGEVEQILGELTREVLKTRIRERLP